MSAPAAATSSSMNGSRNGTANQAVEAARGQVIAHLHRSSMPANLKERLVHDVDGEGHYSRLQNIRSLKVLKDNAGYCAHVTAGCCCQTSTLIDDGTVGTLQKDAEHYFLGSGYHTYCCCGTEVGNQRFPLNNVDKALINGPNGFVTISEGRVGVLQVQGDFKLLAPGTYQWFSPAVNFLASVNVTAPVARLGPYTLITVSEGEVAVTFNNGDLAVLGLSKAEPTRTYFLDESGWQFKACLSMAMQTDRLEGNNLLTKDNVEIVMVAMSQWRIVDPALAVTRCACDDNMDGIRVKVNNLIRATIARIVAGTCIGKGPVSGSVARPVAVAQPVDGALLSTATNNTNGGNKDESAHLAGMMQSDHASHHMAELAENMSSMGIEVLGVFIPEKRMKNDDIRTVIARQAVIGIQADAERSSADAKAYATITSARAEAQAIAELAKAHAEAGRMLGGAEGTAARLALTDKTASVLNNAKVTIFSGSPGNMPFMLNAADTQRMN